METEHIFVAEEERLLRLDKLLAQRFPQYSRTYFQRLIEQGLILTNGKQLKKGELPSVGAEIEICFTLTAEIALEPESIPLDILYEDEHLIAVNKPAGMVVHPAPGHPSHTFVNALLFHCKELPSSGDLRPGIVHRLDKDTSGLLLAAKTSFAHQKLVAMFSQRQIRKYYLAICIGNPGNIEIAAPLGRHLTRRKEIAVVPSGKEAISRCKVLAYNQQLAAVEVELVTGRTHQIRVHLQHRGTPLLGDLVYGSATANCAHGASRQLLHSHRIALAHPVTGAYLEWTAPLPEDISKFYRLLCSR